MSPKSFQVIQGVDVIQGVSMIGLRQNVSFRTLPINKLQHQQYIRKE